MTTAQRRRARVRAPELVGRDWLNTGGQGIRLADLRGKIVLLDFCAHVAGCEAVFTRWEQGDTSDLTSLLNHPGRPLRAYLKTSYLRVEDRRQKLLGA
ncbi:thioredoxin domain-containing protein [Saccharothrix syringae]|uniref:Uncharacterized protein n=1 Tax=Saccharothrix syringae TaxID=103733 RepID=A0A5Q0HCW2_SACSY|nr:hypothetical protein [Saccharothrix syringae]QFZ23814.1 hypothetical protein EKG83_45925 [Saccharothrix syringae]